MLDMVRFCISLGQKYEDSHLVSTLRVIQGGIWVRECFKIRLLTVASEQANENAESHKACTVETLKTSMVPISSMYLWHAHTSFHALQFFCFLRWRHVCDRTGEVRMYTYIYISIFLEYFKRHACSHELYTHMMCMFIYMYIYWIGLGAGVVPTK